MCRFIHANKGTNHSLSTISLILVLSAMLFTVVPVRGDEATLVAPVPGNGTLLSINASEVPSAAPTISYCKGICGEGGPNSEGYLVDPDFATEYQWNLRVPVCSGASCEKATCAELSMRLRTKDLSDFECRKHQVELQRTALCTCTDPSEDDDFGMGNDDYWDNRTTRAFKPAARYTLLGVMSALFIACWVGLYIGIQHDDAEKEANGDNDEDVE
ncbi:unnamed protein product [Pseudo-nitzschia multistriata]|uniref:Uncharacterized protein n=1 Tax=Pseudo-nitzschia multistriata TaxID=183589 RepID=A0A448YWQ4_9STRA|nr:unnamed protein product [Pseudo-nitzschia multistriata]